MFVGALLLPKTGNVHNFHHNQTTQKKMTIYELFIPSADGHCHRRVDVIIEIDIMT